MATFNDPFSLPSIQEKLPEIQKRARRAKRLRESQAQFQRMRDRDEPLGQVMQGTQGSLYHVPGRYIPNTYGQAMKAIGAVGDIWEGRRADKAEDQYNASRNPEILGAVQAMSSQPQDTTGQIAQALGLPPQAGPMGGAPPPQMGGGAPPPPQMGGAPPPGATNMSGLEGLNPQQQEEMQRVVASMQALEMDQGVIDDYVTRAYAKAGQAPGGNAGPVQTAPFPESAAPTPEQTAPQLAQAMGMQPAEQQPGAPQATDDTLRAYLQLIGGGDLKDITKGRKVHSRGEGTNGNWWITYSDGTMEDTGVKYNENVKPVQDASGAWVPVATSTSGYAQGGVGGGVRTPTPGQIAGSEAEARSRATIGTESELAPMIAATEGAKTEGKKLGETRAEAAAKLPNFKTAYGQLERSARELLAMPGLPRILGGSLMGAVSDDSTLVKPIAEGALSLMDKDASNALAKWKGLSGKIYSTAFETLRGGGQITEKEAQRVADAYANLQRIQDPVQFRQSMEEMLLAYREGMAKLEQVAAGGAAPAPAAPAAPTDPRAALRSKYGL